MTLDLNTTFGIGWDEKFHQTVDFRPDPGIENKAVVLYPQETFQTMEGFGGAVTDAAGYVYSLMDEDQKRQLLEAYFSPARMNYTTLRVPLDSCDFALEQYEAMSGPDDPFSMARTEKYILPMLRDIQGYVGHPPELMLSPWSPPAFMKTNGKRENGGQLKPEYRAMWAEYLCRYIKEFQDRGFTVRRVSLQNEPHAVQTWDSCTCTASQQKEFLRDFMAPALAHHGLEDVEIFLWDHNKERVYEWMRDVIDETTDPLVVGAAFHWYSGDHFQALDILQRRFPGKKLIASESCFEFYKYGNLAPSAAGQKLAHELMGDLNHGMSAFYDWNLLLDEKGGPNYVKNYCLAPFLYDTHAKKLVPQLLAQYMEHFSHYLVPGSVRIGASSYSQTVETTAWRRPDGTIAVVLLNQDESIAPVCLRLNGQVAEFMLYPQSITTCVIQD